MNLQPKIDPKKFSHKYTVVDSHTAGEPTRIVLGGMPKLKGSTMIEKKNDLIENYDYIRKSLMFEPRGHRDMFGAVVTEPVHDEADFGVIFIETTGCLNMCGHGTIGLVTVLINMGIVEAKEPITEITLDAPAGIVKAVAHVENGKAKSVTLTNVPSFLYKENLTTVIDGREIKYDISFGGSFFLLVNIEQFGLDINENTVEEIIDLGMKILPQVNEEVEMKHPELDISGSEVVEFYGKAHKEGNHASNVVVFGNYQADRSPCGTGTSAKMAFLHQEGKLKVGDAYINESFIGTEFVGRILDTTKVGEYDAVIPEITGSAYVTGCAEYLIDPDDPLKDGFLLG